MEFTFNNKKYKFEDLSDKGKQVWQKLVKLNDEKSDLDILINFWVAQLQTELPKEEVADGSESKE